MPMAGQGAGGGLGDGDHAELGHAVRHEAREALAPGDRRGVDDLAAGPLGDHRLRRLLASHQHAEGVDVHDLVPDLFGDLEERLRLVEPGVVEHHVQATERGDARVDHPPDVGALGDIADRRHGRAARFPERRRRLLGAGFVDVGDAHVGPLGSEALDDAPDARDARLLHAVHRVPRRRRCRVCRSSAAPSLACSSVHSFLRHALGLIRIFTSLPSTVDQPLEAVDRGCRDRGRW